MPEHSKVRSINRKNIEVIQKKTDNMENKTNKNYHQILGDNLRKSRYNPDLARRVNEETEREIRKKELEEKLKRKRKSLDNEQPTEPSIKPDSLEEIIEFCEIPLSKNDYIALLKIYGSIGKPENDSKDNLVRIRIQDNRVFYLNLSDRKLTFLPKEIGNLKALKELYVPNNKFKSVPTIINKLKQKGVYVVV